MAATLTPTWLVPRHVHVCALADAAVVLDLRADRYHGLTQRQSAALSLVVHGWPRALDAGAPPTDTGQAQALAHELAIRGLLTQDDACGKSAAAVVLPGVDEHLHVWEGADWSAIHAADWWVFAMAWVRATLSLRLRRLLHVVERVEHRKAERLAPNPFDPARTRRLLHTFRALRPFFYTTLDQCLLDSLVLIEFLALHEQFPIWVIGVRTGPFAAHSWVQHEHYVLNGAPTYVRAFTPILAV
jgi:hypothetical protein